MKLINREIDALMDLMQEELDKKNALQKKDLKADPKVIRLALKLEKEYTAIPKQLKTILTCNNAHFDNKYYYSKDKDYWLIKAINLLNLKQKPNEVLNPNLRRDIILASADSNTIEEVLTKLKMKK